MTIRVLSITQPTPGVYRLHFDADWWEGPVHWYGQNWRDEQWRNARLQHDYRLLTGITETIGTRPLGRVFHSGRDWLELYCLQGPPPLRPGDWVRVEGRR